MDSSNINDLLECSVCLETLGTNHKVLPCQHTFCTPCLLDVRNKRRAQNAGNAGPEIICPECRTPCPVSLEQLPSNVILNRILEGMKHSASSSSLQGSPQKRPQPVRGESPAAANIPGNLATNPFLSMLDTQPAPTPPTPALDPQSPVPVLPPKPAFFPAPGGPRPTPPTRPKPTAGPGGPTPSAGHQIYRAMYDYSPCKPDELPLKKNDLYIVIEKCQDGWFKGSAVQGCKTGVFPGNYVLHIQHQEILQPQKADTVLKSKDQNRNVDLIDLTASPNSSNQDNNESDNITSIFDTKLSLVPPNVTTPFLQQMQKRESARRAIPAANPLPKPPALSAAPRPAPRVPPHSGQPANQNIPAKERYRCTSAFPASSQFELDLKEGDTVMMIKKREDGWCKGMIEGTEKVGLFPAIFVSKIS